MQSRKSPSIRKRTASLAAAAIALLGTSGAAQGEPAFLDGLERVRAAMERSQWRNAEGRLRRLLEQHARADYVRPHQLAIAEDLKRCKFRLSHKRPHPNSLVQGDLIYHRERLGAIKIRYTPRTLGDFASRGSRVNTLFHPLEFNGPYSVTIAVKSYPTEAGGVRVFVCDDDRGAIDVVFGYATLADHTYVPMAIHRTDKSGRTELAAPKMSPVKPGKPHELRVAVGHTGVTAYVDGKLVMSAKKPRGQFGGFGLQETDFAYLMVQGKAQLAWLQGKVDKHMQAELARFERTYDARKVLPAWLLEETSDAAPRPAETESRPVAHKTYPGIIAPTQVAAVNRAAQLTNEKHYDEARRYLETARKGELPAAVRSYLLGISYSGLRRPDLALPHCESVCRADPSFADGYNLLARVLVQLGRRRDAIPVYARVVRDHPQDAHAYEALAFLHFALGQPDDARRLLADAQKQRLTLRNSAELERMLTMAQKGPNWHRSFDYKSNNYHVFSDIDYKTCVQAARVLEQACVAYKSRLLGVPPQKKRFRVYIFSGEAGYHAYCEKILGQRRGHTEGLYSPALEQLLVWNLPNRQEMLETVRHEGFHQYLDRVLEDPPVWFNEGLAQYYEVANQRTGRVEGGVLREDLLAVLRKNRDKMIPLEKLLFMDPQSFYAMAEITYPQCWAFVHFLRKTTRAREKLFRDIFQALRKDDASGELRRVFARVPMKTLELEFKDHVMNTGRQGAQLSAPVR